MSARIYSILLSLYPADLRRDFGAEMMQVFLEDLEENRRRCGFRGAVRVWWHSIKELCRIVAPVEASRREIAVPFIVYVLQSIYLGGIMLLQRREPAAHLIPLMLIFPLFPAIIASIALRIGNGSVPEPLDLSGK